MNLNKNNSNSWKKYMATRNFLVNANSTEEDKPKNSFIKYVLLSFVADVALRGQPDLDAGVYEGTLDFLDEMFEKAGLYSVLDDLLQQHRFDQIMKSEYIRNLLEEVEQGAYQRAE